MPHVIETKELEIRVPEPQVIRDRLADVLREAENLRELLKLASKLSQLGKKGAVPNAGA